MQALKQDEQIPGELAQSKPVGQERDENNEKENIDSDIEEYNDDEVDL